MASASDAAASARTADGGVTPKKRGSALVTSTGTGPVSCGGSSWTAVSPSAVARAPHSGQNRAFLVRREPQLAHSRSRDGTDLLCLFRLWIERLERLGRAPPERPHELAIVVVGDLAGAVVELELLQRRERAVAFLGPRDPNLLLWLGRVKPVVLRRRIAQEGPGDEKHACHGEHDPQREPHVRPSWRACTSRGTSSRACRAGRRRRRRGSARRRRCPCPP